MTGFARIDLSRLPAPQVIETPDAEAMLAEMKAYAIALDPELEPFLALESEPATKLLQTCAYFRMLDRAAFNDGARASMLALSTGADLDNLAVYWGVERLVVQDANDEVTPPIPQIMESDAALRKRTQLSLEGHSVAGPVGAYMFHGLSASGQVRDISVVSPTPRHVEITVLSHGGTGVPTQDVLDQVETYLKPRRPLTDQVSVMAPQVLEFTVVATITLFPGPDSAPVLAEALAAIDTYLTDINRLGYDVKRSGILAALHRQNVQSVELSAPAADIDVGPRQVAYCGLAPIIVIGDRDV